MPVVTVTRAGSARRLIVRYPYAPEVTAVVRDIPGAEWSKDYKIWTLPSTPVNVLQLRDGLRQLRPAWMLDIPRDIAEELNRAYGQEKAARSARERGDADVDFDFVTEPYAHQRAGLAFLQHLDGGALLWEMGLGKTKTAIDFAEWLGRCPDCKGVGWIAVPDRNGEPEQGQCDPRLPIHVLVICPNTIKGNWANEVRKHADHDDFVIPRGTIDKRMTQLASARYTIVNCETLSIKKMAEALRGIDWDLVIVDESTRFKSHSAERTKNLMKLKPRRRIILTGTPITGKPQDAYSQFEWVAPGTFGDRYWKFEERFLVKDFFHNVIGIKPGMTEELKARIDSHSYRILKEQVLDLPPKVYIDRTVEMSGEQLRAYNQMRDELRVEIVNRPDLTAQNILTMVLRLTQITAGFVGEKGNEVWLGGAKQDDLDGLIREELATEQVVVFGLYQFELEQLALRYAAHETLGNALPIIYGPTPERQRTLFVEDFQHGRRRLLFCQSRTGGIGINLTAAQNGLYNTRGWSLEEYLQSQDRLHRIGQTGTVSIIHMLADKSVDLDIASALADRKNMADDLTGDDARRLAGRLLG